MALEHHALDHFFSRAAKFTIFIPIVVILTAVGFKAYDMAAPEHTQNVLAPTTPRQLSPSPKLPQLDLNGPYVCGYQTKESTLSAYIKNKNVYIANQKSAATDYVVLKGDCLYLWEKGSFAGDKICGLGQYLSLYDMFSQFGGLSKLLPAGALGALSKFTSPSLSQSGNSLKSIDFTHAMESCRKKDFTNTAIFNVPTTILFKNVNIEDLKKSVAPTPVRY